MRFWRSSARTREARASPTIVALLLAERDRILCRARRVVSPAVCIAGEQTYELPDEARVRRKRGLPGELGRGDRVLEQAAGLLELAELHQRLPEVGEDRKTQRIMRRERRRCAKEQVGGRVHVTADECTPARRRKPLRSLGADCDGVFVGQSKLDQISVRLLQVVAGDLLELGRPGRRLRGRPIARTAREALRARA